jgi:hypothetical protein
VLVEEESKKGVGGCAAGNRKCAECACVNCAESGDPPLLSSERENASVRFLH